MDARRIESGHTVSVHVHARLDHANELHMIDDRLAEAIGDVDDQLERGGGGQAFRCIDGPVAVLVESAAALEEGERALAARRHRELSLGTETVRKGVDADRSDPVCGHPAGDREEALFLVRAEPVAEDRYRPAVRWSWSLRQQEIEIDLLVRPDPLRDAGPRRYRLDESTRPEVIG